MYASTIFKTLKFAALAGVLAVGSASMRADQMTFTGTTTGGFNADMPSNMDTYKGLTFNGGTFTGTTAGNQVAIGTNDPIDNFGIVSLATDPNGTMKYGGTTFTLLIDFTDPNGIIGGQTSNFVAKVTGTVTDDNGGVTLNFNPNKQSYSFNDGTTMGTFTLNLNNVSIKPGFSNDISGKITEQSTAVTPEPNSLMLLGTGFVSAAGMLMRRRKLMNA